MADTVFLKVPVELLQYSIQNHLLKELRLFLILKLQSSGTYLMDVNSICELTTILGYKHQKSTSMHLNKLKDLGWVNFDNNSNLLFIKGFERIRYKLKFKYRTGVYIYHDDLKTSQHLKGFAAGAVINSLINSQRRKLRKSEPIKGRSKEGNLNNKSGYCQVAISVLMSVFKCSQGQAYILKIAAKKLGYIKLRKSFNKTGYLIDYVQGFKNGNPELAHKLACKKGQIMVKDCDLMKGYMKMSRREKI